MKYFRLIIIGLIITNIAAERLKKRQSDNNDSEESDNFNDEIKQEGLKTFSTINNETIGMIRKYSRNSGKWEPLEFVRNGKSIIGPEDSDIMSRQNIDIPDKMVIGKRVLGWGAISGPQECARQCVAGEQPKICYFDWTANYYSTLGGACDLCVPKTNSSIVNDCECIYGDGYNISGMTTINRMFPGPAIQVCLGDLVVVDLTNNMDGNEMTIHWHGIYQHNYQYYDGVPLITQCPIKSRTTFRYQWLAQNIGTHWWHSHTGLQQAKMLNGMIVIREPKEYDPNSRLYDRDDVDNHIFLSDWMHTLPDQHFPGAYGPPVVGQRADNVLINGQGQWLDPATGKLTTTPLATINVKPGLRYRFRLVNSGNWDCPMQLTIQNHDLTIIAADGENVKPRVVNTITSFPAERFDFILNANQKPGVFWIQLRLIGFCFDQEIIQWGILRYSVPGVSSQPTLARPTYNNPLSTGIIFNNINEVCNGTDPTAVCVKSLESADPVNPRILADKTDLQFVLPFTFYSYDRKMLFRAGTANPFLNPSGNPTGVVPLVNGISNVLPTSPLLTQAGNIPESQICNGNRKPSNCLNNPVCQCTHVIRIPLGASVELIMYDNDRTANLSHPFHLHGYGFHVMAQGSQYDVQLTSQNIHRALQLDRQKYKFNNQPPVKDVLAVPPSGYTIVRFIADNPGYWFYHCHILPHLITGMSLTFHVGTDRDLPPIPENFPTCGNFKPPVSFRYN